LQIGSEYASYVLDKNLLFTINYALSFFPYNGPDRIN